MGVGSKAKQTNKKSLEYYLNVAALLLCFVFSFSNWPSIQHKVFARENRKVQTKHRIASKGLRQEIKPNEFCSPCECKDTMGRPLPNSVWVFLMLTAKDSEDTEV